ncbi:MAG: 4-hydroxythreonine-4-phosphate dehydrogenase [Cyanobium sp.]
MLRLLLLGSILLVLGLAFRNGWVVVDWNKFLSDINLPFLAQPEPARKLHYK